MTSLSDLSRTLSVIEQFTRILDRLTSAARCQITQPFSRADLFEPDSPQCISVGTVMPQARVGILTRACLRFRRTDISVMENHWLKIGITDRSPILRPRRSLVLPSAFPRVLCGKIHDAD